MHDAGSVGVEGSKQALRDSSFGRAADGIMTAMPNAELHGRMPVILDRQ